MITTNNRFYVNRGGGVGTRSFVLIRPNMMANRANEISDVYLDATLLSLCMRQVGKEMLTDLDTMNMVLGRLSITGLYSHIFPEFAGFKRIRMVCGIPLPIGVMDQHTRDCIMNYRLYGVARFNIRGNYYSSFDHQFAPWLHHGKKEDSFVMFDGSGFVETTVRDKGPDQWRKQERRIAVRWLIAKDSHRSVELKVAPYDPEASYRLFIKRFVFEKPNA